MREAYYEKDIFWEDAIEENIENLKNHVVELIRSDPYFKRPFELFFVEDLIADMAPDTFESYRKLDGEDYRPFGKWDKNYFQKQVNYLLENCSEERIDHLRAVGRALYHEHRSRMIIPYATLATCIMTLGMLLLHVGNVL